MPHVTNFGKIPKYNKTEERGILSEVKEMFFWWIYPLIGLGFTLLPLLIILFIFKSL